MSGPLSSAFVVGVALGATAMPAFATTCYEVIDRNGVVIFRDTNSPVDLSTAGAPAREAMRGRGELLVIYDQATCGPEVGLASQGSSRTLTTDEIVAGWRSFGKSGFGGTYGSTMSSAGGVLAPMPTNVGITPAAQEAAASRGGR